LLTTIAQYREASEAYLAKGALAAEGIKAVINDEQVVGINWLYSNAIGGVKLAVESGSAKQAVDVLKSHVTEHDAQERSSRTIRLQQAIGVLTILLLASWVLPMLVIAVPILALGRRRAERPGTSLTD